MRQDMAERFSEPKHGPKRSPKYPRHQKRVCQPDRDGELPIFQGMRRPALVSRTGFRYGPEKDWSILRRFLRKRRGKLWDEVYSEICDSADNRNHDGHVLREAVAYLVEQNCQLGEKGAVLDAEGHAINGWSERFYVHPQTGRLEWVPNRRNQRRVPAAESKIHELDGVKYFQFDGVWYRVRTKKFPWLRDDWNRPYLATAVPDVFGQPEPPKTKHPGYWYWHSHQLYEDRYGRDKDDSLIYCEWKQAASKKEIRRLKKEYGID